MKHKTAWAVAAAVVLVVLFLPGLVFAPTNMHALAAAFDPERGPHETPRIEASGTVSGDGLRLVVHGGIPLRYDEALDRTLVASRFCNHQPCGPLLWLAGDRRDGMAGPLLLTTTQAVLTLERVGQEHGPDGAPMPSSRSGVDVAVDATFQSESVWPPALVRLGLASIPLVAFAWLLPPGVVWWRRVLIAGAPLGGAGLVVWTRDLSWDLLPYIFVLLALTIGATIALGLHARKRRVQPEALAVLLFAFSFWRGLDAFRSYFPLSGAGD